MNPLPQTLGGSGETRRKKNPKSSDGLPGVDFGGLGTRMKQGNLPGDGVKLAFEVPRVDVVINNNTAAGLGVINSGASKIPPGFAAWAREFVALQRERLRIQGETSKALDRWWASLPEPLRLFLLSLVDPGDWRRYECATWRALPEPMRQAILIEARGINRHCRGLDCL